MPEVCIVLGSLLMSGKPMLPKTMGGRSLSLVADRCREWNALEQFAIPQTRHSNWGLDALVEPVLDQ